MSIFKKVVNSQIIIGFLSFVLFWEIIHLVIPTHTIPSPIETFSYLFTVLGEIVLHSIGSLLRVLISILISLVIGIPIGILLGVNKRFNAAFSPFLYYMYPIPKVAFLPVFMLLFGLGNVSKVILIIFIIVFQIILSVRDGVRQIPTTYFKVMNSFSASNKQQYRYLIMPAI